MKRQQGGSILLSGVPRKRMTPDTQHVELNNDQAWVDFDGRTDKIITLATPQDAFKRVHEMMHARHSSAKHGKRVYAGILQQVMDITEDCRIHLKHWPWRNGQTPQPILESANNVICHERNVIRENLSNDPEFKGSWRDFATKLRQTAVLCGISQTVAQYDIITDAGFGTYFEEEFARRILLLLSRDKEGEAAQLLQSAFFEPPELPMTPPHGGYNKTNGNGGYVKQPHMEVINLPLTERIPEAVRGSRRATSGCRLHRPSLRKPVLPQRLFIRRATTEPGGTVLIDASGSMGSFDQITEWCQKAPFGTIAYYAGNSCTKGWLYIFAKNGKRSRNPVEPPDHGNTVDGPAITWLMSQARPRIMVTDRHFCDAVDSDAQIIRLARLEKQGEITVLDYRRKEED